MVQLSVENCKPTLISRMSCHEGIQANLTVAPRSYENNCKTLAHEKRCLQPISTLATDN